MGNIVWKGVVEYCASGRCQNGATCHERVDGFVCDCVKPYTGLHCDIVDSCVSDPCLHSGACITTKTSYVCDCTGTGYDGFTCHVPHNDCQPDSCLHGGTCVDWFKSFTCQCIAGFAGDRCEVELSACVSDPCQHGGTCIDVHAGSSGLMSPSFQCLCIEGVEGDHCEINYDDCMDGDCGNGTCVDGINTYTCDCGTGYYGDHCQNKYKDQCNTQHPCQNGATCVQVGDDYHCDCLPFQQGHITHGGKNCSVLLRGCESVHECHNAAVCVPVLVDEAKNIHDYTCSCSHGFKGRHCDVTTSIHLSAGSYVRKTYISDYKLALRFRTSENNAVLFYDRVGSGFVSVEIVNGSLFLAKGDNSGVSEISEALTNSTLGDSYWHSLVIEVSTNTTITLTDSLCNTVDDCRLSVQRPQDGGNFKEIFIGQVTVATWLTETLSMAPFTGCIQDVSFNSDTVIPQNYGVAEFHQIQMSCPACLVHTCEGQGHCRQSQKTTFECYCSGQFVNGVCSMFQGVSCNFESGFCGWTHATSSHKWIRNRGSTGSSSTGPSSDHTTGRGYYIYTEASGVYYKHMKLNSPHFDVPTGTCLTFWVHMYGSTMGTLTVFQWIEYTKYQLWTISGNQGNGWHQHKVTLQKGHNSYLQFDGYTGRSYYSDMAIDDVKLSVGKCQ